MDIAVSVVDKFPVSTGILGNTKLCELADAAIDAAYNGKPFDSIDAEIDEVVYALYEITSEERAVMEAYIAERTN